MKNRFSIKNYEIIETTLNDVERSPLIIFNFSASDVDWTFPKWDLQKINTETNFILFEFSFYGNKKEIIINDRNVDNILLEKMMKYKNIIVSFYDNEGHTFSTIISL